MFKYFSSIDLGNKIFSLLAKHSFKKRFIISNCSPLFKYLEVFSGLLKKYISGFSFLTFIKSLINCPYSVKHILEDNFAIKPFGF